MSSISDVARSNMLTELVQSDDGTKSNVDLFEEILSTPGQTFITETDATTGNQYYLYLGGL